MSDLSVLESMLSGDPAGCARFVSRQSAESWPGLLAAVDVLRSTAFGLMLREPDAFVAHKFRAPDMPLDVEPFRLAVEAAQSDRPGEVAASLAGLSLDQLALVCRIASLLGDAVRLSLQSVPGGV